MNGDCSKRQKDLPRPLATPIASSLASPYFLPPLWFTFATNANFQFFTSDRVYDRIIFSSRDIYFLFMYLPRLHYPATLRVYDRLILISRKLYFLITFLPRLHYPAELLGYTQTIFATIHNFVLFPYSSTTLTRTKFNTHINSRIVRQNSIPCQVTHLPLGILQT